MSIVQSNTCKICRQALVGSDRGTFPWCTGCIVASCKSAEKFISSRTLSVEPDHDGDRKEDLALDQALEHEGTSDPQEPTGWSDILPTKD